MGVIAAEIVPSTCILKDVLKEAEKITCPTDQILQCADGSKVDTAGKSMCAKGTPQCCTKEKRCSDAKKPAITKVDDIKKPAITKVGDTKKVDDIKNVGGSGQQPPKKPPKVF